MQAIGTARCCPAWQVENNADRPSWCEDSRTGIQDRCRAPRLTSKRTHDHEPIDTLREVHEEREA